MPLPRSSRRCDPTAAGAVGELFLLVLVPVHPRNAKRRELIRQTWLDMQRGENTRAAMRALEAAGDEAGSGSDADA